jgi:DNA mismatch repair ATPase MutL
MKAIISLAVLGLAVTWSSSVFAENETDKMVAEMKKCDVCKNLTDNMELMISMGWETHKIDNGMLSLTTVPKDKKKDFDKVNGKMRHAIEQVKTDAKAGKEVHLCSFCSEMAQLMKAGAKAQHVETETGEIELCTSDDPAVVKKIHELADKAIAMQKQIADEQRTASLQ